MTPRAIAILRPSALGDLVFALPALRALRDTWPHARLVYLGKAWHAGFLPGRGVADEAIEVPPARGVTADETDEAELESFCRRMRERRFDLALQLFGGGQQSNPLVARLGARRTVGLRAEDAPPLDATVPYVPLQNERLRLLEVAALAGARTAELAPRLPVLERDWRELEARLPLPERVIAVLQPGARDPRRRWPPERFAAVGDALARAGATVVVQGSAEEREITRCVVQKMGCEAIDAGGALSRGGLTALLAGARVVVSNDTGPLHLADALGARSVGIYWLSNLLVSAPLSFARHRPVVSLRVRCPVCGAENLRSRCAHAPSFVDDVGVQEVTARALELWHAGASATAGAEPAAG